ncbi:alpha/beta hydrolase fold domain-containing protein [Hyphobacterium sp.]|uniref:alpha/beta hydrolase fold domain-containing protein n=1 Tax=Hyphobacterium sp. TaxID=2004662 RepID=UPI003B517DEC
MHRLLAAALGAAFLIGPAFAQDEGPLVTPDQRNVVYGMVSGAAMLMDVYLPEESNGLGVVVIPGSGWYRPEIYSAPPLKDMVGYDYMRAVVGALNDEGFTAFVINHRSSPGNRFPAAVNDTRRAVRYVRATAGRWGIDPARMATLGHSSGANLATMTALMDDEPGDGADPIDQTSAAVQAVVGIATPFMLAGDPSTASSYAAQTIAMYTGVPFFGMDNHYQVSPPIAVQASPATYVDVNDPPLYMIDAVDDPVVPVDQGDYMLTVLDEAGATYTHVRTEGGEHDPDFDLAAMTAWLEDALEG